MTTSRKGIWMNASDYDTVLNALRSVAVVIEATYGHDETGDRDGSEPTCSAADVFEMVCGLEEIVDDAIEVMENLHGSEEIAR